MMGYGARAAGLSRRVLPLTFLAALSLVVACDDLFVDPAPAPVSLALSYGVSDALASGGVLSAFTKADRVWIRLTRAADGAQFDTIVRLSRTDLTTRVQLAISSEQGRGMVRIETEVRLREQALFRGETTARLEVGTPQSVEVTLLSVAAGVAVPDSIRTLTALGDSAFLRGAVLFATGDTIPEFSLSWVSENPEVAEITSGSWVIARGEGQSRLEAHHEEFARSVTVRVQATVTRVVVTPDALTISVDQFETLEATALDRFGNSLQRAITWSSSDPDVAIVNGAGRVRALAPGLVEVTAAVGDVTGKVRIRVIQ